MPLNTLLSNRRLPRALIAALLLISLILVFRKSIPGNGKRASFLGGEESGPSTEDADGEEFFEFEMLEAGLGSSWLGQEGHPSKHGHGQEHGTQHGHGPIGEEVEDHIGPPESPSIWKHPFAWLSTFFSLTPFSQSPTSASGPQIPSGPHHDLSYQTFAPMDPDPDTLPAAHIFFSEIVIPDDSAVAERPKSAIDFDVQDWHELYPASEEQKLKHLPPMTSSRDPIPEDSFSHTWKRPDWYASALEGGYPEELPKVQFDFSSARASRKRVDARGRGIGWETDSERSEREERQLAVKRAFLYAWGKYKDHAWGHDEIRPVSLTTSNAFQGWGASIIDSLETLLIMGLKGEYELARRHVNMVDFRLVNGRDWAFGWRGKPQSEEGHEGHQQAESTVTEDLPVGTLSTEERNERMLKGLLAQQEEDAIDEATIGSTPMPDVEDDEEVAADKDESEFALHEIKEKRDSIPGSSDHRPTWDWRRPGSAESPHLVAGRDIRSRVGTFETGIRYLGGLMGAYDLSGDELMLDRAKDMARVLMRSFDTLSGLPVNSFDAGSPDYWFTSSRVSLAEVGSMTLELTRLSQITGDPQYFDRAQKAIDYLEQVILPKSELKPLIPFFFDSNVILQQKNSGAPLGGGFGFGAMADSYYEYLIKQHQLIGGATSQYKDLYAGSVDQAYRYLIKESHVVPDRDLLIFGTSNNMMFTPVVDHLTCFAGAMLGLGGRLLDRPRDLHTGERITNTCYWVGASTPTGLQPESAWFYEDDDESRFQNITISVPSEVGDRAHKEEQREILRGAVPGTKTMTNWYIGRPETAESVFYMYRLTGEKKWQDKGWRMFTSWINACLAPGGLSSAKDVRSTHPGLGDNMESFVFAETFKYYYLLQSDPDLISLDDYVFTTEAHPLLLRNQRPGTSKFWDPSPSHLAKLDSELGQTARGSDAQLFQRLEAVRGRQINFQSVPLRPPATPGRLGDISPGTLHGHLPASGLKAGGKGMGGGGGNPDLKPKPPHRGPLIRPRPPPAPEGGHREGKWDDEP